MSANQLKQPGWKTEREYKKKAPKLSHLCTQSDHSENHRNILSHDITVQPGGRLAPKQNVCGVKMGTDAFLTDFA